MCNSLFVKRRRDIYPLNYRGSTLTELGKNTLTCCFGSAGIENQVSCSKQVTYSLNQEDSCIWLHVFDWAMLTHCFWWFNLSGYFSKSLLLAWLALEKERGILWSGISRQSVGVCVCVCKIEIAGEVCAFFSDWQFLQGCSYKQLKPFLKNLQKKK